MNEPDVPAARASATWAMDFGRGVAAVLRDHAALVFLALTVVGASYEFFLYLEFRVNILQFAEPLDFLFAAIRQPVVVVFTLLPLVLLAALDGLSKLLGRLIPAYGRYTRRQEASPRYAGIRRITNAVFVIVYFIYFTLIYSSFIAARLRAGLGRQITVELAQQERGTPRRLEGTLIGTTAKFVFLYQPADTSTHVIPVESVSEMLMRRRGSAPGGGPQTGRR